MLGAVTANSDHDPFPGRSEMAELMRRHDWSATPLGPPNTWPQSLKSVVQVLLTSRFAMWMGWGDDLTFFYNDAYGKMTLGAKHPWALGRPVREVWTEVWSAIESRSAIVFAGDATWDEQLLLFLERSGYREETYHTFSYSPVTDDAGRVRGMLCVVTEETERVVGERRMGLLRDTASAIAASITASELFSAVERVLDGSKDLPFALIYLLDETGKEARLACRIGISADHPRAAATISLADAAAPWPLNEALQSPSGVVIPLDSLDSQDSRDALGSLDDRAGALPNGPWSRPPTHAMLMPIVHAGQRREGVIVAGLNPFRPIDESMRSFIGLLVAQMTAGIANAHAYAEERRRAEALAEIDRAKTTFFSNVSHEFRTPLTLLIGPLADLRRADGADGLPPDVRGHIEVAHRNSLRLLKLVNTLLDVSRIEAGRSQVRFEALDLVAFTRELASTFQSAMASAGLAYSFTADDLAEPVYVDREMWEKIVLNLVSNAFKFTLTGGVSVSLHTRDSRVLLTVRDTGAGIPRHQLSKIFDRFHRVEGTAGRSHEGSGIGLALVNELVKLHQGELTVDSEPGVGSTFTVSVPLGTSHLTSEDVIVRRDAVADDGVGPSAPTPVLARPYVEEAMRWLPSGTSAMATAGEADMSSRQSDAHEPAHAAGTPALARVLLADDNADMRDYAARLLSERWQVTVASNGREALDLVRTFRPDVIVTDVMMPELDGFELLHALRADDDLRMTPVIMLSARAGEEARLEGLAASADDYLVKPFSARDLLARVDAQIIKARERRLEHQQSIRMARLFAHAPVGIAVLRGPDHIYDLANARYRELVGNRDIVGLTIREALPELAGQGIFELLDRVRASGEPYLGRSLRVELIRTPDAEAEDVFFDVVYQPVFDAEGRVEMIVVIVHDVTALAAAKESAEAASRVKDEFLATLSHELRTPLNAVLGYTQMLRGGVVTPERFVPVLETIERNAKLQEKLINDVLDVSRIITGKMRIDIQPVDLSRVIQEALDTVTPAAAAKGIRLQSAIDRPAGPVAGDAERLQQVLWNLLSNAIKFTGKGGRVQVRLQRVNSHVEITVSDTGEGIAPEFLPHLFMRFSQADTTFARTHGGLGLGLAICRHLVEAHGGHIEAHSPGKGLGTTVRVELPLMIVHDTKVGSPDRIHPSADLLAAADDLILTDLAGLRVLLVDDDSDALAMAKDTLELAGATVVTVTNALDALRAINREHFDAAVLDIGMPQVDGYELLNQIRAHPDASKASLSVAALTAYARTADRTRSLQAGFQMHLSKPVQPSELTAAVRALVRAPRR